VKGQAVQLALYFVKTYYKLKERNNMRNVFITTVAAMAISTAAFAEDTVTTVTPTVAPTGLVISGAVNLDFAETAGDNYGGTMGVELDIDAGSMAAVALDFEVDEDGNGSLADWTVGTTVAGAGVAFGTDNGVMPATDAVANATGTLATPAMTESLAVTTSGLTAVLGFTDWNTDVTDISNVQGAYTFGTAGLDVTASADYNRTSENTVLGAEVAGLDLGLATAGAMVTYDLDAETFAYESNMTTGGLTAYLNGDNDDMLQNLGGEYTYNVQDNLELTSGVNYNVDSKDLTPAVGLSFNF
jgi:hypothetical protein